MPRLVNQSENLTLKDCIERAVKKTVRINEKHKFYAVTCYFDPEAVSILAKCITEAIKEAKGQLIGFYVFIDVGAWFKYRGNKEDLIQTVCRETGLLNKMVDFIAINYNNRLFHAKSYSLISVKNKENNSDKRKGFVASTSGNLTKQGLGIGDYSNVEYLELLSSSNILEDFLKIINDLEQNHVASNKLIGKHNDFLLAIRIFGAGHFYHKWEGNMSNEVRFKLTLTEKGKKALIADSSIFRNFKPESKSVSRDPLNLESIFVNIPKPFPKQFWANFSVDTLIGRWVPSNIAELVDDVLNESIQPYMEKIEKRTKKVNLKRIESELIYEVTELWKKKYVTEKKGDVIPTWLNKANKFRENKELIKLRIHNYEKIPDILDSTNRTLILQTFKRLRNQLDIPSQLKGLKAILNRNIKNYNIMKFDKDLNDLKKNAKKMLKTHKNG